MNLEQKVENSTPFYLLLCQITGALLQNKRMPVCYLLVTLLAAWFASKKMHWHYLTPWFQHICQNWFLCIDIKTNPIKFIESWCLMPRGSWYTCQLMHNICVQTWIGWYVCQPMHNICIIIYVRLCHQSSCAGSPIKLHLVTSGLTSRVIKSKKYSTITKTYLHVKIFYQNQRNLHRNQKVY